MKLNWLFYNPSRLLQVSEFVWTLGSSAWVGFNNFLLINVTDRSKISSDQKRLFFAISLNPLFANTPFKVLSPLLKILFLQMKVNNLTVEDKLVQFIGNLNWNKTHISFPINHFVSKKAFQINEWKRWMKKEKSMKLYQWNKYFLVNCDRSQNIKLN